LIQLGDSLCLKLAAICTYTHVHLNVLLAPSVMPSSKMSSLSAFCSLLSLCFVCCLCCWNTSLFLSCLLFQALRRWRRRVLEALLCLTQVHTAV